MERLRVGLTAVVLLLSGHGHGRADYVFPYRFGNLGSGAAPFSNPSGAAADVSRRVQSADAPEHRIQVFISSGTFITRLSTLRTGTRQIFEPGDEVEARSANPILADLLNLFARQSSSHSAFFLNLSGMGIDGEQSNNSLGRDLLLSADTFVSDPLNRRSEVSTSDEALLASFGNLGAADAQPARPVRAPIPAVPPADMLFSDKVGLSLVFFGLAGLATLGYAWRQRKSPLQRTSGGRRRPISPYRSSSLPNPRGTISSPPP